MNFCGRKLYFGEIISKDKHGETCVSGSDKTEKFDWCRVRWSKKICDRHYNRFLKNDLLLVSCEKNTRKTLYLSCIFRPEIHTLAKLY